jgi:hypothetical protein
MQAFNSEKLIELKYCERCGGLWLRAKGSERIFCGPCRNELAEYPPARTKTGRGGPRNGKSRSVQCAAVPVMQGVTNELWSGSVL